MRTMEAQDNPGRTRGGICAFLLLAVGTLLFGYVAVRAYGLSMTWDEAYTYLQFVRQGVVWPDFHPDLVFPGKYHVMSANNHVLNTWLMTISVRLFGNAEWALRLPNVLMYSLFLLYSGLLARRLGNATLVCLSFTMLNANPYLVDFFSLGRGYGLSWAFIMGSLYHLERFLRGHARNRHALLSACLAALAAFAHLTVLVYFLALVALLLFIDFVRTLGLRTGNPPRFLLPVRSAVIIVLSLAVLGLLVPLAFHFKEVGTLFGGGQRGFWRDTVEGIVENTLYGQAYGAWTAAPVKIFMLVGVIAVFIRVVWMFLRRQDERTPFLAALLWLLGATWLASVIQHHLVGTLYLNGRTGAFLLLPLMVMFCFFFAELTRRNRAFQVLPWTVGAAMAAHFLSCANLVSVHEWKFDADTKRMIADLRAAHPTPRAELPNISIGIPLWFEPSINYYRITQGLDWLNTPLRLETASPLHDYYYLDAETARGMADGSLVIVKRYPVTGNILARPARAPKNVRTLAATSFDFESPESAAADGPAFDGRGSLHVLPETESRDLLVHRLPAGPAGATNLRAGFSMMTRAPGTPMYDVYLLFALGDEAGNVYWGLPHSLSDFIRIPGAWSRVTGSAILPAEAKPGHTLKVSLWNPNRQELHVDNVNVVLAQYEF
ncbi:MAG: glycosyltransferase family 39 protein [Kiritimatiellae bacterium]|nr:glycosyltransferase family 39 protein [Kiritimatiellia bacterium]